MCATGTEWESASDNEERETRPAVRGLLSSDNNGRSAQDSELDDGYGADNVMSAAKLEFKLEGPKLPPLV
jgi:hypothetical protein